MFGKGYVLAGEVVVGLGVCRGDNVRDSATEHETEEALGCFVEVASIHQTLIKGGFGGSNGYRMFIHGDQKQSGNRRGLRFFIMAVLSRWSG
jgi:hypothetical protein